MKHMIEHRKTGPKGKAAEKLKIAELILLMAN